MSEAKIRRVVEEFEAMKRELPSALFNVIFIGAQRAAEGARRRVRIDTATLHDNIRTNTISVSPPIVQILAGGQGVNPRTGRVVDYAAALEAKYPYMQPAVNAAIPSIRRAIDRLRAVYQERIDRT